MSLFFLLNTAVAIAETYFVIDLCADFTPFAQFSFNFFQASNVRVFRPNSRCSLCNRQFCFNFCFRLQRRAELQIRLHIYLEIRVDPFVTFASLLLPPL